MGLHISTDKPVSAIQFALRWHASALAFDSASTTAPWRLFSHEPEAQGVRIVAADFTGEQAFKDDNAPLVSVHFRYRPDQNDPQILSLELDDVLTTDGTGEKVPVIGRNGEIDTALRPEPPVISFDKLHIEEILADPASSEQGDANGDGIRHSREDEFIELVNRGDEAIDLSGYLLSDDDVALDKMFKFPEGTTIAPGERLVLFGGGSPNGIPGQVYTDDSSIGNGLTNSGDVIVLIDPTAGDTLLVVAFESDAKDQSLVQKDGEWVGHSTLYTGFFSPGEASQPITDTSDNGEGDESDGNTDDETTDTGDESTDGNIDGNMGDQSTDEPENGVSVPDSTAGMPDAEPDSVASELPEPVNRPPHFLSATDTLALVGLAFQYMPRVHDPDGDIPDLRVREPLAWLRWEGEHLSGLATERDTGRVHVVIWASDGRDSVAHRVSVRAISLRAQLGKIGPIYQSMTWRHQIDVPLSVQVQVDGGPEWHAKDRSLVWKPHEVGEYPVTVAFSTAQGDELFLPVSIAVWPKPALKLHSVLVEPQRDVNGDGRVDAFEDQYVTIANFGDRPIDISGWLLGDDDGALTRLPAGTVLGIDDRLVLVGKIQAVAAERVFSAGGRIGNGLAKSDHILLIAPAGPDTLINVRYTGGTPGQPIVFETDQVVDMPSPDDAESSEEETDDPIQTDRKRVIYPSPNPFNSATRFGFYTVGGPVYMTVYNILGQPVRRLIHQNLPAGYYQRIWDGTNDSGIAVSSGVYLVYLKDREATLTQRVALLR